MAQHSWVGQTLGDRYKIEDVLGKGGMSAVYKATDPNLKRVVAIKMIHPHLSDNPEFVVRFKEEAAAVAQLRHANIVRVFDFNNDGDVYYMVLEFLPGETLQARLKRLNATNRQLPTTDAIQFAIQTCKAADYAHQRNMVHRDIKPANVILDIYGKAILMDFGIAKIVGGQQHTATGATLGTALYMSPEQIRGDRVDERSDIYSIGVTLFEMVSGRPPYEADSAMTLMMMHLNDPVPDLHQLRPETPDDLVAVIEKALAKDRNERFQSAAEMAVALRKVLDRLQSAPAGVTVVEDRKPEEKPLAATLAEAPGLQGEKVAGVLVEEQVKRPASAASSAASIGASQAPPVTEPPAGHFGQALSSVSSLPAQRRLSPMLIGGAAVGVVALLVLAFVLGSAFSGRDDSSAGTASESTATAAALAQDVTNTVAAQSQNATSTAIALALIASPTPQPTIEEARAALIPPTETSAPTAQPTNTVAPTATEEPSPTEYVPTKTNTPIAQPTNTVAPTATEAPSATPYVPTPTSAPTLVPTLTQPPGPYARIRQITAQGNDYVVDYETVGFVETLDGWHTHFFFNTVPLDQAGVPGVGPWILYYGPSPFTEYKVSDRPPNATQMCVLVANADHTLYYPPSGTLNTGNCVDLP